MDVTADWLREQIAQLEAAKTQAMADANARGGALQLARLLLARLETPEPEAASLTVAEEETPEPEAASLTVAEEETPEPEAVSPGVVET